MALGTWLRRGTVLAIVVRVLAAAALTLGPWTDEPSELDGWDVARFQAIADADGTPYVDHEVEYPPLTVVVTEVVLADEVVASHQRLVWLSLLVDLGLAAALARWWRPEVAAAYLLIGLPMVPSGLLRLDLWAGLAAVLAAAAIAPFRQFPSQHDALERRRPSLELVAFSLAVVAGAMIKLWPALLIAAAVGVGKIRHAAVAAAGGLIAGLAWLALTTTDAVRQITSLRGVTGWHVESVPGSLIALFTSEEPRFEADAYRIGELSSAVVTVGRALTILVVIAAAVLAQRSNRQPDERLALVMTVSLAALIVTAPLLSPQFLLWLTPWAAILFRHRTLLALSSGAIALTALTLATFGPPGVDHPIAATSLLLRDAALVGIVVLGLRTLATPGWFSYREPQDSDRLELG